MSKPIRVLIADDHTIVRSGVRLLLEAEADIKVVGEALDGNEVLAMAGTLQPDIILMDIAMPGMDGLEATRQIKDNWPEIQILVLTMHRSDEYFFEMLRLGASGYVLKGADPRELISAVKVVARGEVFLYPTMAQKLLKDYLGRVGRSEDTDPQLSPREEQILRLLAEGYSNKEIAERLVISPSTVYTHRGNLMLKLGLTSRRELIQYARKRGYLQDY
jgi:two-component system response regulator NreC